MSANMQHDWKHWRLRREDSGLAWLELDKADASANVLSSEVMSEFASVLDVLDKINEKLGVAAEPKKMAFEVRGTGKLYFINKKGDKEYRKLKTFDTSKEAFAYIKDNYDDLVTAWEGVKDRDNVGKGDVRNETNRPRTGSDWRGNLSKARALQALINSAKADAKFVSDSFIRVSRLSHGDGDVNVPRPFGSSDWPSLPGGVNPKLHERLSYMAAVSVHLLRNLSEAESFGVELLGLGHLAFVHVRSGAARL